MIMLLGSSSIFAQNASDWLEQLTDTYCQVKGCDNGTPKFSNKMVQDFRANPEMFQNNAEIFTNYSIVGTKCYTGLYNWCPLGVSMAWGQACSCYYPNGWVQPGIVGN